MRPGMSHESALTASRNGVDCNGRNGQALSVFTWPAKRARVAYLLVPESELKACPNCHELVGGWRSTCECGWNFETQRREEARQSNDGSADEVDRCGDIQRQRDFARALEEYKQSSTQDQDSEAYEQLQFLRVLHERYPQRPGRVIVAWLCVAALTFAATGALALAIVPLIWISWNAFWMSRVRRQERKLVAVCARLRMSGSTHLAERVEQFIPLVRHAPGVVDDVLAHIGVVD